MAQILYSNRLITIPFTEKASCTTKSKAVIDFIIADIKNIEYGFTMMTFKNDDCATMLLHEYIALGIESTKKKQFQTLYDAYFPVEEEILAKPVAKPAAKRAPKVEEIVVKRVAKPATKPHKAVQEDNFDI